MNELLIAGLLGGLGGIVRSILGLLKALVSKRKLYWKYWSLTTIIAVLIGAFTGIIFDYDPKLSLLAGYAGTDILEGIYKSFKTEKWIAVKGR